MDTERSLFIGALCSLSAPAISLLQAPKVKSCSYILSADDTIQIIDICHSIIQRYHCGAGGKPWFDRACPEYVSHFDKLSVTRIEGLTMTGCVTLSPPVRQADLSKGVCRFIAPGDSPKLEDCRSDNFKAYVRVNDETADLPGRIVR